VHALRATAQRIQALDAEAASLKAEIATLVAAAVPWLLEVRGVGPISAAQLLVSWSHPGRFRSEAAFAALAGTSPIPAASGQVTAIASTVAGTASSTAPYTPWCWCGCATTPRPRPTPLGGPPRARACATSSAASSAPSPGSCSGSWSATTSLAWRSCEPLDSTGQPATAPTHEAGTVLCVPWSSGAASRQA
jgi:Transposase IS116/IS110/IS902 family